MNKWKMKVYNAVSVLVVIVGVIGIIWALYMLYEELHPDKKNPVVMTQEEATDAKTVEEKVHVSPAESRIISREIERSTDTPPVVTYYVQAPTLEKAAAETAKAIKTQSPKLPPAAAKKSDRTIVTADKDRQKVDVYKINLNKSHKIKAGVMTADGKTYGGIGYQAGRWEGMVYTRTGRKVEAAALTYTIAEW